MKYTAPEMEVRALEVEDIIMSVNEEDSVVDGEGNVGTPDEEL